MFTASAIAANTICRSACGAAAPLFTQYMFDALGVGGGGSLIGGVATLLAPVPFIFYRYGEPIRIRSKFAPTPEKKMDEVEASSEERVPARNDSSRSDSSTDTEERAERTHLEKSDVPESTGGERRHGDGMAIDKDIEKGVL